MTPASIPRRPGWRWAAPAVLVVLVLALALLQYRWSAELGAAARDRMGRDLRVATQTAAAAVDLELTRLLSTLETTPADTAALGAVLARWDSSHPELAGLVGAVGWSGPEGWHWSVPPATAVLLPPRRVAPDGGSPAIGFRLDSLALVRTLTPLLAARVAQHAELDVSVALVHRSGNQARVFARVGAPTDDPPDIVVPLMSPAGAARVVFLGSDLSGAAESGSSPVTWSESLGSAAAVEWELQAWHGAGSLERAVAALRRRNLALGLGLVVLVAAVGGTTLMAFRRHQRLAEDRALILAGISHELRTPLALIRSAAENLRQGVVQGAGPTVEYAGLIEGAAERLAGTLDGAIGFARGIALDGAAAERIDVVATVREVAAETDRPERIRLVAGGAAWCLADHDALAMAVRNLLANALDYSPPDAPVTVEVGSSRAGATITVEDAGPGIDPRDLPRIFEPFVRGAEAARSRRGGLGLGLALADRVARLHGGRIDVSPRPGGGTRFTLSLPAAR